MNMHGQQYVGGNPHFDGMGNHKITGFGNYFPEGFAGHAACEKLASQNSQQNSSFQIITEWRILETNNPEAAPVGAILSYVINFEHQPAKGNYQAVLSALCGIDPKDTASVQQNVNPQLAAFASSPNNPMRGRVVGIQTSTGKRTQGRGKGGVHPITLFTWLPADQNVWKDKAAQLMAQPAVPPSRPTTGAAGGQQSQYGGYAPPLGGPPPGFQMPQGYQQPQAAAPYGYQQPTQPGYGAPQGAPQPQPGYGAPQGAPQLPFAPQGAPGAGGTAPGAPQLPFAPAPQGAPQLPFAPQGAPGAGGTAPGAPQLPFAPQAQPPQQWIPHPQDPTYEYLPGSTLPPRKRA